MQPALHKLRTCCLNPSCSSFFLAFAIELRRNFASLKIILIWWAHGQFWANQGGALQDLSSDLANFIINSCSVERKIAFLHCRTVSFQNQMRWQVKGACCKFRWQLSPYSQKNFPMKGILPALFASDVLTDLLTFNSKAHNHWNLSSKVWLPKLR